MRLVSSLRSRDARVGFVFRRRFGGTAPCSTSSRRRSMQRSWFARCERCSSQAKRSSASVDGGAPSGGASAPTRCEPASRAIRARAASSTPAISARATRNCARDSILFTFCPPGPPDREKVNRRSCGRTHARGPSAMAFGGRSAGGRLTMCIGAANHRRCRRFVTACWRPQPC